MRTEEWAVIATIALAFLGYLVAYVQQRRTEKRAARLDHLNRQIRSLYGPLYATLMANDAVWKAFVAKHWPAHGQPTYFTSQGSTTPEEDETWRLWMIEVFAPLNDRIEKLILENGDLIEGHEFPSMFIDALAHIAAYRAVHHRWRNGDFSQHASVCNFPAELSNHVSSVFRQLLDKRKRL